MGVKDLLKEVRKHCCKDFHLKEAKGKRIGIDISGWMHMIPSGLNNKTKSCTISTKLILLLNFVITPVVVFDGPTLPAKAETAKKRKESFERQRRKGAPVSGRTTEFTEEVKKLCRQMGIEYYVAPHEADGQLAFLQQIGYIDYIITNDSDFILLGCTNVIYNMVGEHGKLYLREKLKNIFPRLHWKRNLFQLICAIIDSDYFKNGIHGISWKKGLELYKKLYKLNFEIDEIPNASWKELLKAVDGMLKGKQKGDPSRPQGDELKKKLEMVLQTYHYQQVYDPRNSTICPLNPYKPGKTSKDYPFAGVVTEMNDHTIETYTPPKNCNEDVKTRKLCRICWKEFASWEERWNHYNKEHMYECDICQKEVLGERRLIMHQYDIHNVGNSSKDDALCDDAKTKREKVYAWASRQLAEKERPKCSICPEYPKFNTFDCFRRHMLNFHNQVIGKFYDCYLCDKGFLYPQMLKNHISHTHCKKERPHICDICNKDLCLHQKCHQPIVPLKCKLCNKVLTTRFKWTYHMATYHDNLKHFCQMCVTGYKTRQDLNEHVETYHPETREEVKGEGHVQCPICDVWINENDCYHIATHTHEFGWTCKICDQALASGPLLKIHMLLAHPKNAPVYNCKDCGKCYKNRVHLKQHRYIVHSPKKLYVCQLCDYETQLQFNFKSHLLAKHLHERWYPCSKCGVGFTTIYKLREHFKTANHKKEPVEIKKYPKFEDIPKSHIVNGVEHCGVDGCTFTVINNWRNMNDHLQKVHLENRKENKAFVCRYCKKPLLSKTQLYTHQRFCKDNGQLYKCIHHAHGCSYTTSSCQDMDKHIKICSKRLKHVEYPKKLPTTHRVSLVLYKHVEFVPEPTLLDSRTKSRDRLYACTVPGCRGKANRGDQPFMTRFSIMHNNHIPGLHLAKPSEQTYSCGKDPHCTRIFLLPKELQDEHDCEFTRYPNTSLDEEIDSSDLDSSPPKKKKRTS